MKRIHVETGQRFSELTIEREIKNQRRRVFECRCDCGKDVTVTLDKLISGTTKSCGCRRTRLLNTYNFKHGSCESPEYIIWANMKQRCYDSNHHSFKDYGGRGIRVCPRWKNSFQAFMDDMGARPTTLHSIERMNTDGPYTISNCRWATKIEQARNTRANVLLTHGGHTRCIAEWADVVGIKQATIARRIRTGWSHERALTKAPRPWNR